MACSLCLVGCWCLIGIVEGFSGLGWPRFQKSSEKFRLAVFYESYAILEWENTFGFVSSCKTTLLKHSEIYKENSIPVFFLSFSYSVDQM